MKKNLLHLKGEVVSADDSGIVEATVASTAVLDRHGDTIQQDGWQLKNFKTNPVILWSHNMADTDGMPIGKALKVWIDGEGKNAKLMFKCQFDMADDFAAKVYRKIKDGFINMVSVGFMPIEWERIDEEDFWSGFNFTKQDLLEISWVPVPANPQAGVQVRSLGVEPIEEKDLFSPEMEMRRMAKKKTETEEKTLEPEVELPDGEKQTDDYQKLLTDAQEKIKELETELAQTKAGRTISAKHEAMLNQAVENIKNVLATAQPQSEEDDEKTVSPSLLKKLQKELRIQDKSIGLTLRLLKSLEVTGGGDENE